MFVYWSSPNKLCVTAAMAFRVYTVYRESSCIRWDPEYWLPFLHRGEPEAVALEVEVEDVVDVLVFEVDDVPDADAEAGAEAEPGLGPEPEPEPGAESEPLEVGVSVKLDPKPVKVTVSVKTDPEPVKVTVSVNLDPEPVDNAVSAEPNPEFMVCIWPEAITC